MERILENIFIHSTSSEAQYHSIMYYSGKLRPNSLQKVLRFNLNNFELNEFDPDVFSPHLWRNQNWQYKQKENGYFREKFSTKKKQIL